MTVKVLIVDDEALVRAGFRMILDAQPDIEVRGEAADGTEAVREALRLLPDVILMDIRMREVSGLEATRTILGESPRPVRIIVVTTFDYDEYVYEALRAGASAFLLKDTPPEQLVTAVRVVAAGDAMLHPSITRRLIEDFAARPAPGAVPAGLADLTECEREVLGLVARGRSNAEIATDLFVSEATVKTHVAHVFAKLGLRDRVQATILAYECGLVQPGASSG